ncbi:MAG: ABC transporter substrate-binding protein [Acidimicrobiaceae bacterium]|nr:ABC transporter substrate-binding protein [Acidimicrobiaceae bacterium]MYC43880.1 ABC transporter substrate-binding protein [Acidimicrobiaceae bacterium]
MSNLPSRWLAVLLALVFFAAACGGETTADPSDDNDDERTVEQGDDSGDTGDAPETTTGDGAGDGVGDDAGDGVGDDAGDGAGEQAPQATNETPQQEAAPNIYKDPRGGIFAEFQQGFDRGDHPFMQVDSFCLRHDPAADRVDTDDGITADSIKVGHIRSRLEDLTGIGFAVPVGDPKEMYEVFIDYINSECGGIRGRTLVLGYAEADVLGVDVDGSRNAACLAMTEDFNAVIVMNSTGFGGTANLCLTEEQQTAFISNSGQPEEFLARADGRLISMAPSSEETLRFMVSDLLSSGELEGLTLGVAAGNAPGEAEAVEEGLVIPLREAGFDIVFDVIDCGGGTICFGGTPESVTNMINAGVDGFFNVLNVVSAPGYIAEMVNQGYEPGDVRFFTSEFGAQANELVAGQIANNVEAGNLYNGARIVDYKTTGEFRDPDFEPNAMAALCNELYGAYSPSGASHDWRTLGDSAFGMVETVCDVVRIMARTLYDAGDNPTLADVHEALVNLGPVDVNGMTPASIRPGKTQASDAIQTLDFIFPCDQRLPFIRRAGDPVCITGRNDFRPAPR